MTILKKICLTVLLSLCLTTAIANLNPSLLANNQVFSVQAKVLDPQTIHVHWAIAQGYYLYQDRIQFTITAPKEAHIGKFTLPEGVVRHDALLGNYRVYANTLDVKLPIKNLQQDNLSLLIAYQGCSENNFCYPPQKKLLTLAMNSNHTNWVSGIDQQQTPVLTTAHSSTNTAQPISAQDKITQLLNSHNLLLILISFFSFGLLLTFTPCVLPMIPILSGLIIGHGKNMNMSKACRLSACYILGMSITYAIAGVISGFLGNSIQASLQNPWVISLFSLMFVLLALSLFGFYDIRLPSRLTAKISSLSNQQKSGSYLGAMIMGCLSTLIVSPCITPPLVGALAYIGNTGDSILGGLALFAMGIGMGIPLLIIGTFGAKLLPKAGPWMNNVKVFFGIILLSVAIWMISRVIPTPITLFLWASLLLISAVYLGLLHFTHRTGWGKLRQGIALILSIYGVLLMIGASRGNTNPLQPLVSNLSYADTTTTPQKVTKPLFSMVHSVDELQQAVNNHHNKITLVDFYADWCVSCQELEQTFHDPTVQQELKKFNLIRADVTENNDTTRALQHHLNVAAPPTIVFIDTDGDEFSAFRIVGTIKPADFLYHLQKLEPYITSQVSS